MKEEKGEEGAVRGRSCRWSCRAGVSRAIRRGSGARRWKRLEKGEEKKEKEQEGNTREDETTKSEDCYHSRRATELIGAKQNEGGERRGAVISRGG
jgi:hypothetical protein